MRKETSILGSRKTIRWAWVGLPLALAVSAFGWSASGTVKSTTGTALSGVEVTVKDDATLKTSTDASGAFSLSVSGAFHRPGIQLGARVEGSELVIPTSESGMLDISLVDAAGKSLWHAMAAPTGAETRISLPSFRSTGAVFLRVRQEGTVVHQAVGIGPEGWQVAPPSVAARAMAGLPVLQFKKSGYRDTTYTLTSETATAIEIKMSEVSTTTCPAAKLNPGDQNKTITVKGTQRKYILHVPSAYKGDTPVPLVVDYHPIMGTASGQLSGTTYKAQTDPEGVISVYPDGLNGPLGGQAWNVQGCCSTADDTSFARAMVAEVKTLACIDPKRVYATGFSMGGGMTHFSACHLSDIFAAGAPAAFDLTEQNVGACKPKRPITMVMFRGTSDGTVAYAGGHSAVVPGMAIDFLGAKGTFTKWAELNKCTGSPSAEDSKGCSTYSTCEGGVQVTLCTKQGGGHEQGNGSVGWPILKKYTLP
ncbi:MAG TPA: PHB depolymerase family esterase [Fibrobacteria bacterium]|nr:PHB depolymerase family esterase [Fibrobacteria bacterium]HOX52543.1 PHB depolymerase family esterase [Fibrobacteria bacterium]